MVIDLGVAGDSAVLFWSMWGFQRPFKQFDMEQSTELKGKI
jgi:hypothetical protein